MKANRKLCGHCDAGLPIQCTCGPEWFVRKEEVDERYCWWLYYWPLGNSEPTRIGWARSFKDAKFLFPRLAKQVLEVKL